MYSSVYVFVSFYALRSCVIVFMYVLVSRCVYFLICICIKYWLIRILSLVVSYSTPLPLKYLPIGYEPRLISFVSIENLAFGAK
jgi:hypothetical protein